MIVALSRFKVANGLQDAVRQAFLERPRLVDTTPGFLGLETFTDSQDESIFYLVTRWTDEASFGKWHASSDHLRSHEQIPKGLKLDASFTLLRTLHRISPSGAPLSADRGRDSASIVSEFMNSSNSVYWLNVNSGGVIESSNRAAAGTLDGSEDLRGKPIWPFLTEPDADNLRRIVETGIRNPGLRRRFNFVGRDGMPFTLECQVDPQPDGFVLIGEVVQEHERALELELMKMNNQLAVLLRENSRKMKALDQANAALQEALKDLRESHWHLKKIQEVLPICMGCGKVMTGESKWEEVADFLRKNSLFLSHGYCPCCVALGRPLEQER